MTERVLLATTALALQQLENLELASANNAIQLYGVCSKQNHAYAKLLDFALIYEDGKPREAETLKRALAFEVNRRVQAGTFN